MESPEFSSFKSFMFCGERAKVDMISQLLDTQEFVLFFKLKGSVFGGPEESRIVYAKMKNPDEDMTGKWKDDFSFVAVNLDDIVSGHGSQRVFGFKDLKNIKVIDKEKAAEELGKKVTK